MTSCVYIVTSLVLVCIMSATTAERGCPEGMEFVFDRCLQKHSEMLHDEAKDICQAAGHTMVNPDSDEFYTELMKWNKVQEEAPKTKFWMGVSNQHSTDDSVHYWEQDLKVPVTWALWAPRQPRKMTDRCVVANRKDKNWVGRNCNKNKAIAVCEAPAFTCPDDFYFVHDRCIRVHKPRMTHNEAKALCEEDGYEMFKPDSELFFTEFMNWAFTEGIPRSYWLGISNQGSEDPSVYHWEDMSPLTWTNWRNDHPWAVADRCALAKDIDRSWISQKCSTKKAQAVCQTAARECPPGFEMVGGRCLQKFSKMPHDAAKEMCESAGHGMLTPDTPEFFNAFMEWNQVQDMSESTSFWMGISNQESEDPKDFYWEKVLYLPITWSSWGKNRPANKSDMCVVANNQAKAWVDKKCSSETAIAVCQAPFKYCPDGFEVVYDRCLQKHKPAIHHDKAKALCEDAGYKMVMPNSKEYFDAFMKWNQVRFSLNMRYWIGATNQGETDNLHYYLEDGLKTPLEFAPWGRNQPIDKPDRCTLVNRFTHKYYSYRCSFKKAIAVCETPINSKM